MAATIVRFLVTIAAIPLCANYMKGVDLINLNNAIVLGLILGVLYCVLRPVLRFVLKPFNFCTLGILNLLLDAWIVQLGADLVKNSIAFDSFWWALAVSLVINAGHLLVDMATDRDKKRDRG